MSLPFLLSPDKEIAVREEADGGLLVQFPGGRVVFTEPPAGIRRALDWLRSGGATEEQLADAVLEGGGAPALAQWYYCLEQFRRRRLLRYTAATDGRPLASLTGIAVQDEVWNPAARYVASRFAYSRREETEAVLETPLSPARVILHDGRAAALVHALARPHNREEMLREVPTLPADAVPLLMELLLQGKAAGRATDDGVADVDEGLPLRQWEFHDLLFHARSRAGRHANPHGGTFRFAGRIDPSPALKQPMSSTTIALPRPDGERLLREDPPFARVQEQRRSRRDGGAAPLTDRQLGEFLYRVGRVTARQEAEMDTPGGKIKTSFARRPYPGAGAVYELELYLAVHACADVSAGLYHYDPAAHRLCRLCEKTEEVRVLLMDAAASAGARRLPPVLVVVAARFARVFWKYATMGYAAILKDVGVLFQTMYLAAAAMGLAACALGNGDSDRFARAAGLDYYAETSVGEFLLGGATEA